VKTASCPSCGAPVEFKSAASLYAVCEYCRSTLLRHGEDLENIGRMADLLEDSSLIQIGSEGKFRGVHFGVIGRIQLKHEAGVWNEWHILFDDGRNGWLSEAGGEYVVSAQVAVKEEIPPFESLVPEMAVTLAGRSFTVTDLETARCVSGQGELPFRVEAGYDVNAADLRGGDRFVTIDYSETPPIVFVGYPAPYKDLNLANLREAKDSATGGAPNIKAQAFNCPHCASPLTIHSPAIESLGCESCGSIIGVENEKLKLLSRAAQSVTIPPTLPLGSKGRLHGIDWEIIGFMKRSTTVEGVDYAWSEYLLFSIGEGFAWLVEDQGHWNYARTVSEIPGVARGQQRFKYQQRDYRHFDSGTAEVDYVVGEFYWRVSVGETCKTDDYVSPPLMLSREYSEKEVTWTLAEYLDREELQAAFDLKESLPTPVGVYANQENPWEERHRGICKLFWKFAAGALVLQLVFAFVFASVVLKHRFVASPTAQEDVSVNSPDFVLKSTARTLVVRHKTDIDNNWLALTTTLIEKNSGKAWLGQQEISHYSGVDGGESWSEGSKGDEIVFKNVPAGTYFLDIDYELGADRRRQVIDSIEVERDAPGWSNFVFLLIFLVVFPLFSRGRHKSFETRRWNESSLYAPADESDDE
jgi:ribosomal protein S27E